MLTEDVKVGSVYTFRPKADCLIKAGEAVEVLEKDDCADGFPFLVITAGEEKFVDHVAADELEEIKEEED